MAYDAEKLLVILFHLSDEPIGELVARPIWFSTTLNQHEGFLRNARRGFGYRARLEASRVADYRDPDVVALLSAAGTDVAGYVADLINNPAPEEVLSLPATGVLIAAGYTALTHPDYDPDDPSRDVLSVLVFDPSEHVLEWMKMESSG